MAAEFSFIPLGAIVQSITIKGLNIVQGFPTADLYKKHSEPHFGETIGRVANRIKDAKLNSLNGGNTYTLSKNDGENSLHGGVVGWGNREWTGPTPVGTKTIPGVDGLEGGESVQFTLTSEHLDEQFPGEVNASVIYTTGTQTVDGKIVSVLGMEYEAELVGGAEETVINMTNHSYFNLSGAPTIEGTSVSLCTNQHLSVVNGIPTGGPTPYNFVETGSPLPVNTPFTLGPTAPDVDDCFITNLDPATVPIDTRSQPLTTYVKASHPATGIHLEVAATEPAFQFYTGKYIDVPECVGPSMETVPARGKRSGFCVEPSRWVNACNVPEWKNMVLLKKNEKYGARIVYKIWSE